MTRASCAAASSVGLWQRADGPSASHAALVPQVRTRPRAPRPRRCPAARLDGLGGDLASPARAASSEARAARELGREHGRVGAARAVRGAAGMARALDPLAARSPSTRTSAPSSVWPPVTTTARGPERVHGARQVLLRGVLARGRPARGPPAGSGVATVARGSRRSTSAARARRLEQTARRSRRPSRGRPRPEHRRRARAPRRRRRSSRASPSIPILTASTPMSSATALTWRDDRSPAGPNGSRRRRPCSAR